MKKEIPILFSTPMVQAILSGRKTMTRRIVKPKYSNTDLEWREDKHGKRLIEIQNEVPPPKRRKKPDGSYSVKYKLKAYRNMICPYGKSGDILWVRETWCDYNMG